MSTMTLEDLNLMQSEKLLYVLSQLMVPGTRQFYEYAVLCREHFEQEVQDYNDYMRSVEIDIGQWGSFNGRV